MRGVGVPDQGASDTWEVPEDREGLKVAQNGSQGLPRPRLRVHAGCGELVSVTSTIRCPVHGYLIPTDVTMISGER